MIEEFKQEQIELDKKRKDLKTLNKEFAENINKI